MRIVWLGCSMLLAPNIYLQCLSKDAWEVLKSDTKACVSKFPWKSMGICKFLYLRNGGQISNFDTMWTILSTIIQYFVIKKTQINLKQNIQCLILCDILKLHNHPQCIGKPLHCVYKGSKLHKGRAMNKVRVVRGESHMSMAFT